MKKILGMFICMLLIATVVPAVTSEKNTIILSKVVNTQQTSMAVNWTEIQKLLASDGEAGDGFGGYVSLDGDTMVIGAPRDDSVRGAAYVFTLSGSIWTQEAKLIASDGATGDNFGCSVSLDDDTALIGAVLDDSWRGSAYVFTRTGTTWTQQAKLLASDGEPDDNFGFSVSLDGDTALIGTPALYSSSTGAAYVFTRSGSTWTQQAKLLASDGAAGDWFGLSVSLDGDSAVIGAVADDSARGSAYVFIRSGSTWTQEAKLLASDGAANDWFGWSVSLDSDTTLIGALYDIDSGINAGSSYVFTRSGTTWTQQTKLLSSDGSGGDRFGCSVTLDGDTALIGAAGDDDNGFQSGSAYVFTCSGTSWTQQAKLLASDSEVGDSFGDYVSLDGDTALIGAPNDDSDRGAAYIFTKEENHPPNTPDKPSGETNGKINTEYTYSTSTIDIDGDQVWYLWDWGDGSTSTWLGPYNSGDDATADHTWTTKGDYSIKVKAKDTQDTESDWSEPLAITMPCSYDHPFLQFLKLLFERFPNAFPLLRHLMRY